MSKSVLIDTSFMIHLRKSDSSLHKRANEIFRSLIENQLIVFFSSISVAEYCIKDDFKNLPVNNIQLLTFNHKHATLSAKFDRIILNNIHPTPPRSERRIIRNDIYLMAQAETQKADVYITSDTKSKNKIYTPLKNEQVVSFKFMDMVNDELTSMFPDSSSNQMTLDL